MKKKRETKNDNKKLNRLIKDLAALRIKVISGTLIYIHKSVIRTIADHITCQLSQPLYTIYLVVDAVVDIWWYISKRAYGLKI
jgi:hypothetical protein